MQFPRNFNHKNRGDMWIVVSRNPIIPYNPSTHCPFWSIEKLFDKIRKRRDSFNTQKSWRIMILPLKKLKYILYRLFRQLRAFVGIVTEFQIEKKSVEFWEKDTQSCQASKKDPF